MSNILMIAEARTFKSPLTPHQRLIRTQWMPMSDLYDLNSVYASYEGTLWSVFHTRSAYAQILTKIDSVVIAYNWDEYAASALISEFDRERWLIEYVMTHPKDEKEGFGSAVMDHIMREAQDRGVTWVQLKCDPKKNNGQLPRFYAKFGFKEVTL